ncbi:MAG: WYL domain-containing protein [Treponema sp.]|nr:WYL domain-containing protein [Treponema sp.]
MMKKEQRSPRALTTKTALARIYRLDAEIAAGRYPNSDYLAQACEVSISTISRDLDFMRYQLDAPIEYDALRRGFYYSEKTFRLPAGFTGADELLALGMAKNILTMYQDTPIYEAANNLLNCIIAPLSAGGDAQWYENRIVVPRLPPSPIAPGIWDPITASIKENRVLTFEYLGTYDEDYQLRRVRPYQLLFDNGLWYLYGYAEERKGTRIFSLARMQKVTLTTDRFTLPANYDYRASSSGSYFGVFMGQETYTFKVAFYDYSMAWVRDRTWAEDQEISETGEGLIITFTSSQFEKVYEWVLSRGSTAQPLEPELLVQLWEENIEEMQKMVNSR